MFITRRGGGGESFSQCLQLIGKMTNRKASTVCTRWNCVGCACAFATICKRLEPTTGCTSRDGKQKKTKEKRNSCKASLQVLSPHQEKTRTLMLGSVRNNSQTSSTRWRIIGSAMFETFLRCTSHHSTATPFERRNNSFILEKDKSFKN